MEFNPYKKLSDLFKKHIDLKVSEEEYEDRFYHQMEYLDWQLDDNNKVEFIGSPPTQPYTLMNGFGAGEDKIPIILKEFNEYIKSIRTPLDSLILNAIKELEKLNIPTGCIYIPYIFSKLFWANTFLGISVYRWGMYSNNKTLKVESPKQYGRFIEIDL